MKAGLDSLKQKIEARYEKYGYSPETLGLKGRDKQFERYKILTSQYNFNGKSVLDIGCGFGDLNQQLFELTNGNYVYTGIDFSHGIIEEAKERYKGKDRQFFNGEFLDFEFHEEYDYGILSGMLNYPMDDDNYTYVYKVMKKALSLCKDGIAFDFLSDKVDYKYDYVFYYDPAQILKIAYGFSRRLLLRNDYFPFEFSVYVYNDDSFSKEDTTFIQYNH